MSEQKPFGEIGHLTESGSNFPTPWEARTYHPEGDYPYTTTRGEHEVWSADGYLVAEVDTRQVADLIAAAPDLKEACQEFVRKVEAGEAKSTRSYQQMKAALAKAERSHDQ
jgi:hypothetical protein